MIRTIVVANHANLTLTLPDDFIGKQVEIIAFVIEEAMQKQSKKRSFTVLNIPNELMVNYRFNRDEANER